MIKEDPEDMGFSFFAERYQVFFRFLYFFHIFSFAASLVF